MALKITGGEKMVQITNKLGVKKIIPMSLAIKMRKQRDIEFWTEIEMKDEVVTETKEVIVTDSALKDAEKERDMALIEARRAYQEKFNKPVPNNKVNNAEWILEKLNETPNE